MAMYKLLCIIVLCFVNDGATQDVAGMSCTFYNGLRGACIPFEWCQPTRYMLNLDGGLKYCSAPWKKTSVCCLNDIATNPFIFNLKFLINVYDSVVPGKPPVSISGPTYSTGPFLPFINVVPNGWPTTTPRLPVTRPTYPRWPPVSASNPKWPAVSSSNPKWPAFSSSNPKWPAVNTSNPRKPTVITTNNSSNPRRPTVNTTNNSSNPRRPTVNTTNNGSSPRRPTVITTNNSSNPSRPNVITTNNSSNPRRPTVITTNNSSNPRRPTVNTTNNGSNPLLPTVISTNNGSNSRRPTVNTTNNGSNPRRPTVNTTNNGSNPLLPTVISTNNGSNPRRSTVNTTNNGSNPLLPTVTSTNDGSNPWWRAVSTANPREPSAGPSYTPSTTTTARPVATTPRLGTTTTEYIPKEYDYVTNQPIFDGCRKIDPKLTANKTGRVAWDKCIDYQAQLVYPCQRSAALLGNMVRKNHCAHAEDMRDEYAQRSEFPHMVVVGARSTPDEPLRWYCTGTLISEWFVLTSAHCWSKQNKRDVFYVTLGNLQRIKGNQEAYQEHGVQSIMFYGPYNGWSKTQSGYEYHDIALLKTATEIRLNQWTVPACLDLSGEHSHAVATRWRARSWDNTNEVQKVFLRLLGKMEYQQKFDSSLRQRTYRIANQMGYGSYSYSMDNCKYDNEGSLTVENKEVHCMHTIVGVSSDVKATCGHSPAASFTKVHDYTSWIEETVWPKDNNIV